MRTRILTLAVAALAVTSALPVAAQQARDPADALYIDNHYHLQAFLADATTTVPDLIKTMDAHKISRTVLMSLAFTAQHDPSFEGDFRTGYYLAIDQQGGLYYNAIQDVNLAVAYLALSNADRARFIPMMNAFNLKDANAGRYVLDMIRAFPGVWAGFGELHFKKQEVSQKVAGGTINLFSTAPLEWMKVIQQDLGAFAMVHCDIDVPGTAGLMKETYAPFLYPDGPPPPKFREAFIENVLRPNNKAPLIWAHFGGLGRATDGDVPPRDDHWDVLDKLLADPAFSHVYIDLSWGPVFVGALFDTPEHAKKTIDLVKKYPNRFIYGSDQEGSSWELTLGPAFDAWAPLWKALTPEETRMVRVDNFGKIADQSAANIRAWERKNGLTPR